MRARPRPSSSQSTEHTHTHTHRDGFWMIIYLGKSEVNVSNEGRQELDSAADACGYLRMRKGLLLIWGVRVARCVRCVGWVNGGQQRHVYTLVIYNTNVFGISVESL